MKPTNNLSSTQMSNLTVGSSASTGRGGGLSSPTSRSETSVGGGFTTSGYRFAVNWKPYPKDSLQLLNHTINMIDSASRIEKDHSENFAALQADENLLPKLNEVLLEFEEQKEKIISTIDKDKSGAVGRYILNVTDAIFAVFTFLDKLADVKMLFLVKNQKKSKLETKIANVRNAFNQLTSHVGLTLTAAHVEVHRQIKQETQDGLAVEAYKYLYGIGDISKNYATAYEKFKELAENGHNESMYVVSDFYKNGVVVRKDLVAWCDWLTRAADAGFARAQCELALYLLSQLDIYESEGDKTKDYAAINRAKGEDSFIKAIDMLYAAGNGGYADAQAYLGSLLQREGDIPKAVVCYEKGIEMGSARAGTCLGLLLFKGKGIKVDRERAFELFDSAQKAGCAIACFNAGFCMEFGIGTAIDKKRALDVYEKGATCQEPKSMAALGYLLVRQGLDHDVHDDRVKTLIESDFRKGIYWLHTAAEMDKEPLPFYYLGRIYEQGIGVKSDYVVALENYKKGANRGHAMSALAAGNILYWVQNTIGIDNSNIKPSYTDIASFYAQAAYAGVPEAMNSYALMLEDGSGNENNQPNHGAACGWYHLAGSRGYEDAVLNLAMLLSRGSIKDYCLPADVHTLDDPHTIFVEDQKTKSTTMSVDKALRFLKDFSLDHENSLLPVKLSKLTSYIALVEKLVPMSLLSPPRTNTKATTPKVSDILITSAQKAEAKTSITPKSVTSIKSGAKSQSKSSHKKYGAKPSSISPKSSSSFPIKAESKHPESLASDLDQEIIYSDQNLVPDSINEAPSTKLTLSGGNSHEKRDRHKVNALINSGLTPAEQPFELDMKVPTKNKKSHSRRQQSKNSPEFDML